MNVQEIKQNCSTLNASIDEAIKWIAQNASNDRKEGAINNLKDHRRKINKIANAVQRKPSIALFGESQTGKSYLVSNMCKRTSDAHHFVVNPENEKLLNFITDINPEGGGAEATGLLTRFSLLEKGKSGNEKIKLKLFSTVDIVKIIANSYLSDFKNYKFVPDLDEIQNTIKFFNEKGTVGNTNVLNEDSVFDIIEYLDLRFKDHFLVKALHFYWNDLGKIIHKVPVNESWRVFHFIWGKQAFFTDLFNKMVKTLEELDFSDYVDLPIDTLVPKNVSIIDIMRIKELFLNEKEFEEQYALYNISKGSLYVNVNISGRSVRINRNLLSSLGCELQLYIPEYVIEDSQRSFLKEADILDFPGARSREQVAEDTFETNNFDEKVQLFIRGKVAYLFDMYNLNYDISSLIWCMHDKQCEVRYIPALITKWIADSIGATPQKRLEREQYLRAVLNSPNLAGISPLFVVNTKFNIEMKGNPSEVLGDLKPHYDKWNRRFYRNFNDFVCTNEADKWPDEWLPNSSFKSVFLLRDPKYSTEIFESTESDGMFNEKGLKKEYEQKIMEQKESFVKHSYVQKHFYNPEEAWEEAATPNKSGIDYIIKYLSPVISKELKLIQMKELFMANYEQVLRKIEDFYEGGSIDEQLRKARVNAAKVRIALERLHDANFKFGLLLKYLICPEPLARKEYWKLKMDAAIVKEKTDTKDLNDEELLTLKRMLDRKNIAIEKGKTRYEDVIQQLMVDEGIDDLELLIDIYKDSGFKLELIEQLLEGFEIDTKADEATIYARNLIKEWFIYIDNEQFQKQLCTRLDFPQLLLTTLIIELSKNARRVKIEDTIANAVRPEIINYHVVANQNFDLVARLASNLLNNFITTVGWAYVEENDRPNLDKKEEKVFTYTYKKSFPEKKKLKIEGKFPGTALFENWKSGIKDSFEVNVLSENNMQNPQKAIANQQLGTILKKATDSKTI